MKIEVGKKYELNNGDIHECTFMDGDNPLSVDECGHGPFVIDGCIYHQDGTFGERGYGQNRLDVKRCVSENRDTELTSPYGDGNHPLPDLGERCKVKLDLVDFPTMVAKDYDPFAIPEPFFQKLTARIELRYGNDPDLFGDGDPVSASDTPKTWGDMTDAEKGALLLARFEGKELEYYGNGMNVWYKDHGFCFMRNFAYRIKPEPLVETVTAYAQPELGEGFEVNSHCEHWPFRITFTTTNGEPDLDSIKMERIND